MARSIDALETQKEPPIVTDCHGDGVPVQNTLAGHPSEQLTTEHALLHMRCTTNSARINPKRYADACTLPALTHSTMTARNSLSSLAVAHAKITDIDWSAKSENRSARVGERVGACTGRDGHADYCN